jgi:alpha-mannosidase
LQRRVDNIEDVFLKDPCSHSRRRSSPFWRPIVIAIFVALLAAAAKAQSAWFVDGYHGGVYGHYPSGYTGFLVGQLNKNPDWKINLEIEPETWDVVKASEPEAYAEFKRLMEDQSEAGRIEIVNPGYGQSYLFQASGESVIRQFEYGIRKVREHFPNAIFTTYSSEEPCFTSCLPTVLKSFGFKFASLKNPDTCWGGYTAAHGGELVNWIGPDGSSLLTVPRYASEALQSNSVWQTIAFRNAPEYLAACRKQGIEHPIGMCLQDAGWRGGPWLGKNSASQYETWRGYIRRVTSGKTDDNWHFSQEDVKPGLMWGAQVLQRIAQQSRKAEYHLLTAEKLSAMAFIETGWPARTGAFDEGWKDVLLSQHHDCWIVPYNGRFGNTWADQVQRWTTAANAISDLSVQTSLEALLKAERGRGRHVRLFNLTGSAVDAVTSVPVPANWNASRLVSLDSTGRRFATQLVSFESPNQSALLVRAHVPPMGYATVELRDDAEADEPPVKAFKTNEIVVLESDLYRIEFDPAKGGTIRSLILRKMGNREFVDTKQERRFNELRGNFYEKDGFRSSAEQPAAVTIRESGPLRATVEISGSIAGNGFVQRASVAQRSPVIDCSVRIDWKGNPRIGEFEEKDGHRNRRRPAYDDRFKLVALFPAALRGQKIAKDAPYDVCESELKDTFYNSWDEIKNNVILNWVDETDASDEHGLALFTDHTTSYTHGAEFPLGLTLQYSGKGLWGRDYRIDGASEVHYALMPHAGRWDIAGVSFAAANWRQPVIGALVGGGSAGSRSFFDPGDSGWEIPACYEREGVLFVRLFNANGDHGPHDLGINFEAEKIELVELDGRLIAQLNTSVNHNKRTIRLSMPRFAIRTLRCFGVRAPKQE